MLCWLLDTWTGSSPDGVANFDTTKLTPPVTCTCIPCYQWRPMPLTGQCPCRPVLRQPYACRQRVSIVGWIQQHSCQPRRGLAVQQLSIRRKYQLQWLSVWVYWSILLVAHSCRLSDAIHLVRRNPLGATRSQVAHNLHPAEHTMQLINTAASTANLPACHSHMLSCGIFMHVEIPMSHDVLSKRLQAACLCDSLPKHACRCMMQYAIPPKKLGSRPASGGGGA
jgi:hypothetical protein